ncbi:MAG: microcin transporter [Hyphomicrobiales bacterium]|nr:microcin transporter [Hyphomicrobiales bacterium]
MFRSFFPAPRLFFSSVVVWLALTVLVFFTIGGSVRSVISIDRFLAPAICAPGATPTPGKAAAQVTDPAKSGAAASTADAAGANTSAQAPAATPAPSGATAATTTAGPANCVAEDSSFLNGQKIWLYEYVILVAALFCVFWYFYRRNEWYWWSVVTSTVLLLGIFFSVQIDAWLNDWYGNFYNMIQLAMTSPGKVTTEQYFGELATALYILVPNITAQVLLAFLTSHYVFRWRKAMNIYYMNYWQTIRTTEGEAQRVQEDTMLFATIVEDLGTSLFGSLMTLAVFLPLLWTLSAHITTLPIFGAIPGSLVWVALVSAAFGTVLLAVVGVRLPGLNFENQRVEAAYRKELVYGEDDANRAQPPTARQLFANVQRNYFRLYFHYLYFNIARYAYLQLANFIPIAALGPSIIAGALTLGLFQQVNQAFGQVSGSFQFLASSWTTIIELLSVHKRLRAFESNIPKDAPIVSSLSRAFAEPEARG